MSIDSGRALQADGREPPSAVVVRDLVKKYGDRSVVNGLSFDAQRGEILTLVGPNGAGKTTTVEILEGVRRADTGLVRVLGLDPIRESALLRPRMGAMLQESSLYPTIRPREAVDLFARFYPPGRDPRDLLELVGLSDVSHTPFRRLSGGQKQRLFLALALLGSPEVVFLDEPTAGMDAEGRLTTWGLIRTLRDDGLTVILTTHLLDEAERLSDRVALINHGTVVAIGSVSVLVGERSSAVWLTTSAPIQADTLTQLPSITCVTERASCRYEITTPDTPAALAEIAVEMRTLGVPIRSLQVGTRSLEDVFLELTTSDTQK